MFSISDIEALCVRLNDGVYDAVEIAYGENLDIIWPLPGDSYFYRLFRAIMGNDNQVVGIQALHPLVVDGSITATGNITAGSVSVNDALSNQILYRLDDWANYSTTSGSSTEYWVPAAKIIYPFLARFDSIEAAIQNIGSGSGSGGNASWGTVTTVYANLVLGTEAPKSLLLYDANNEYLYKSVFENLFSYNNTTLTILNSRNLVAPGTISAASHITAGGNIIAGAASSGDSLGNILYRLDNWSEYTSAKTSWVPSAGIVYPILASIDDLQDQIDAIGSGSGGGGTDVSWGTTTVDYADLTVGSSAAKSLLLYDSQNPYLRKSVFDDIFTYTSSLLTVKSPRPLYVVKSITAGENITAGAVSVDNALSNQILYRLDSWGSYSNSTKSWVPSAEIVKGKFDTVESSISSIESSISDLGSGTLQTLYLTVPTGFTVTGSPVTTATGTFAIGFATGYSLPTTAQQLLWDAFASLFTVTDTSVSLNVKDGETHRDFSVTGSITATANITAGAQSVDNALSNQILYRLDSWSEYTSEKSGWVPSAGLVNDIRNEISGLTPGGSGSGGEYDDTEIRFDIQQLTARVVALEARPQIIYVEPEDDYPSDSQKVEGALYVKLSQTSSS